MEGYTLAVDFPNRAEARELIRRLEALRSMPAGGSISPRTASPAATDVPAMYPELAAWQAEVAKADPDGALITDLVRRLSLRSAA